MIYLYKCSEGHVSEHIFPMTKQPKAVSCPVSEGGNPCELSAKRHYQGMPPVHYNGSGFTTTEIPRKSGLEDYQG